MKRIFSVLVSVVLVFAMATIVMAENNVTVNADKDTAYLNDTIEVLVNVAGAPDATTVGIEFTADSCFEFVSGEWLLQGAMVADQPTAAGTAALVYANATDLNGDIIKLVFKVVEDTAATKEISFDVQYVNGTSAVLTENVVKYIEVAKKPMSGVSVTAKSNLVYDGTVRNTVDLINVTGAPVGATTTCDPATITGAFNGNVEVTVAADGYANFVKDVLVNVEKAEAVISGVVAQDKAYDGTEDVTLEVTAETTVDGLLGNDGVTFDLVEGDTFTGLFADAAIGEDKPVVAVKDATQVLTGAAASNYNLILATGVTADITKTAIVPTNVDYSNFNNVIITTATDTVEVNLNKSASAGVMIDNLDGTYALGFEVSFNNDTDADSYDNYVEISVPAADVITLRSDAGMTLGTIDCLPAAAAGTNVQEGYFIKGMKLVIKATPIKTGYRVNKIEIGGQTLSNGGTFNLGSSISSYEVNAVFTKKTSVYPAAGTDKNIIEQTKSNKIVLTIGSTEATVFGTKKTNDVAPIIINDRTMLPARFVAEALGAKVEWNDDTKTVAIFKDMKKIEIVIGDANAYINGQPVALDAPALIQNSRTYMPVRFIAETLGAKVTWNEVTRQVVITK